MRHLRQVEQFALVWRRVRATVRRRAALRIDRPFQQLRALKVIRDEDVRTQAALAERLMIDPPAASRLIDRLVDDGLVERRAGADRRCVRLVTRKGADAAIAIFDEVIDEVDQQLRAHLTAAEARALRDLLDKLAAAVADDAPPPAG